MEEFNLVEIICSNKEEARKITKHLLSKKIISCGNYFPVNSISGWGKDLEEVEEVVLFVKTRKENFETLEKEVKQVHSYEVPCIIKLNAEVNKEYFDWLQDVTEIFGNGNN